MCLCIFCVCLSVCLLLFVSACLCVCTDGVRGRCSPSASSIRYLELPEDAAGVSVVVLPQRDVFHSGAVLLQVTLHMFKEPGFKVQANSVDLTRRANRNVIRDKA